MSFDKNKAMRNAERFLSQGKIRAAINEYQRVVENDSKDFSTLNILGDLYAKSCEKQQAVGCFTKVAEYYNTQGFSHKAIAVYNKISRIEPSRIEISAKLAELYQSKGSIAEARQHYKTLAEHYQQKGQKTEALAIWKQIAELDPNNTEIYIKIAETCLQENQFEEAARAFTESGLRLIKQNKFEPAMLSFSRALEVKKDDPRALKGLVKSQIGLGCADEAAHTLEEVLKEQPHNHDVLYLLVDCYLDVNNAPQAERAVIKLVEQEPANYLKFLDLVKLYLKSGSVDAATRILSMAAENLLIGGHSEEFLEWTNEILARNPEQIGALRLLARYHSWHRNETELKRSLERLAETARVNEAVEDEHYALSQLVAMAPQESEYAKRLQELSAAYGLATQFPTDQTGIFEADTDTEVPQYQNFNAPDDKASAEHNGNAAEFDFAGVSGSYDFEMNGSAAETKDFTFYDGTVEATIVEDVFDTHQQAAFEQANGQVVSDIAFADGLRLQKEIDSIQYYIEQGYKDLAVKSLDELEAEFGARAELANLRRQLNADLTTASPATITPEKIEPAETANELKSEFDTEKEKTAGRDDDYETHYHMGTAYKEMGLLENAIESFQDAISLIETNDGTRRFFRCANNLGHCFMEKQMPEMAAKWFLRDLDVNDLTDHERQAIFYDLGDAYQANGEIEKAIAYFDQIYAENSGYRDTSQRLKSLQSK